VVDDSIMFAAFVFDLRKAGYQVELAKDGQDALEKILSGLQIKAVICDIDMPLMVMACWLVSNRTLLLNGCNCDADFSQWTQGSPTSDLGATAYFLNLTMSRDYYKI